MKNRLTVILFFFFSFCLTAQRPIVGLPIEEGIYDVGKIQFQWNLNPCGNFELQVDSDSAFSSPQSYFTAREDTSLLFSTTGHFFFRIRCLQGEFSTVQHFEVIDIHQMGSILLWLKADSGLTLSNGLVTSWQNVGDTALFLTQNNTNSQPQFLPQGFMGNPAVRFGKNGAPGEATWLNFNSPMQVDSFTLIQSSRQLSNQIFLQYVFGGINMGFHIGGTHAGGKNLGFWDGVFERVAKTTQSLAPRIAAQQRGVFYNNFTPLNTITGGSGGQPILFTAMGVRPDLIPQTFCHADFSEVLLFQNQITVSDILILNKYLASKNTKSLGLPFDTLACGSSISLNIDYPGNYQSVVWSNGSTGANATYTNSGWHWVRAINYFGIIQTDSFFVGGVFPAPVIKETGIKPICLGDTILQVYLNPDPVQPWSWNTGATADTLFVTEPGFYWLLQTDSSGCVLSSDTLTVVNRVSADILVFSMGCDGDTTVFSDDSYDLFGNPIQQYHWDYGPFATGIDSITQIGKAIFLTPGPQTISLVATNDLGCSDTAVLTVQIPASPQAFFIPSAFCANTPLVLNNQSLIPGGTSANQYVWAIQGAPSTNQVSPTVSFLDTGTFAVSLKVFLSNGCADSTFQNIVINKKVVVDFALEQDTLCAGEDFLLLNHTSYVNTARDSAVWTLVDLYWTGDSVFALASPSGKHKVELNILSQDGCKGKMERDLWVVPLPKAELSVSQTLGVPPIELLIWDASTGVGTLEKQFTFNDSLNWQQTPPAIVLIDTGLYVVRLRVVDETGCVDSALKQVRLIEPRLRFNLNNLRCEYQDGGIFTSFELENQSEILTITDQRFEVWTDMTTPAGFSYSQPIPPGLTHVYSPDVQFIGKAPAYCCVKPIQIISEYQTGLSIEVQAPPLCKYIGVDDFYVSTPIPNPSSIESKVLIFASNLTQPIVWILMAPDGKVLERGTLYPQNGLQELKLNLNQISSQFFTLEVQQGDKTFWRKGIVR